MSFFGFDPSRDPTGRGHPATAPGFSQAADPFAGLSRPGENDDDAIDFEDTYDGLGDGLEEAGDAFNDDTFGAAAGGASKPVGKDFDFFGRTADVSEAISEEQLRYSLQQAPPKTAPSISASAPQKPTKPARSGYEKYQNPSYIADLQADPNLWGQAPSHPSVQQTASHGAEGSHNAGTQRTSAAPAPARKMMSLEEVEAQMRSQPKQPAANPLVTLQQQPHAPVQPLQQGATLMALDQQMYSRSQEQMDPRFYQTTIQTSQQAYGAQAGLSQAAARAPHLLHRPQQPSFPLGGSDMQQRQILQNPLWNQASDLPMSTPPPTMNQGLQRGPPTATSGFPPSHIITHPQQLMRLSEEDRAAFLVEDAKRAKRNHKIFLLSKDNGLMTPQDKNFVTRIQLQQLMTATGNANDQDPDAALSEDFYYQVHSQIRVGPRPNPHQPLSHFAQTYLFQTGGRYGGHGRRQNRGADNHMQRMEQQVQRAVEAAKLKPKNKQLVIEGSLGKISFSNAKTPKPMLNIRRNEGAEPNNRPVSAGRTPTGRKTANELPASKRKNILTNIEAVYTTLMTMEDDARKEPPLSSDEANPAMIQQHTEWRQGMQRLNERLWDELKVLEPINPGSPIPHPFIAFLSHSKGKKAIPRVFRHLSTEQRVTMLTMIVFHLDALDVIRLGQLQPGDTPIPAAARDAIDLFSNAVTPSLFSYVSEAPLSTVIGLLGLVLDHVNVPAIARTKVGLSILTMLTSRATLVIDAGGIDDSERQQWTGFYDRLFDTLEPSLAGIFPGSVIAGEDIYVWQFLAAIGSGASPEQQHRLVMAVRTRVTETIEQSKTLPADMASQRKANVNLFLRAIGLDVQLLE